MQGMHRPASKLNPSICVVCCIVLLLSGAEVCRVRPVSITHPDHPVNIARRRAQEVPGAVFADQYENLANYRAHLKTGKCITRVTTQMFPVQANVFNCSYLMPLNIIFY